MKVRICLLLGLLIMSKLALAEERVVVRTSITRAAQALRDEQAQHYPLIEFLIFLFLAVVIIYIVYVIDDVYLSKKRKKIRRVIRLARKKSILRKRPQKK